MNRLSKRRLRRFHHHFGECRVCMDGVRDVLRRGTRANRYGGLMDKR